MVATAERDQFPRKALCSPSAGVGRRPGGAEDEALSAIKTGASPTLAGEFWSPKVQRIRRTEVTFISEPSVVKSLEKVYEARN